tara:strand:+ start:16384 stop:17205 length:822 start_codon:yes stop_codon:yes gene_type:complete
MLIYIIISLTSKLPLNILYVLSKIIYLINKIFIRYRLNIVRKNIINAYPKLTKKKTDLLISRFYKYFFRNIFEIIKAISFSQHDVLEKIKIKNIETIEKSIKQNKSIILIGSHYSNWEWIFLRISLIKNINLYAVYKPLSNYYFNEILLKLRKKFGANLIELNKWKYFIKKGKHSQSTFMFIADQVPNEKSNGKRLTFLNQSTLFYEGPEKTSYLLNADVYYLDCQKIEKGCYLVSLNEINTKKVTEKYAALLEQTINTNPENWLWSHNRWKR